jgi:hypothetical protein
MVASGLYEDVPPGGITIEAALRPIHRPPSHLPHQHDHAADWSDRA